MKFSRGELAWGACMLLATIIAALLTGCMTAVKQGDIVAVTTRFVGIRVQMTTTSTGTPEIWAGAGSQTVYYIPTSTNGPMYSPRFANTASFEQKAWNPFSMTGSENLAAGDVAITNGNPSAVVPKARPELKAIPMP